MISVHHIGYVVRDIESFQSSLPGMELERQVEDPQQNARLALYKVGNGSLVELVQPLGPSAFTWAHLDRFDEGLHHICYHGISAANLDAVLKRHKLFKVRGPIYATLFDRDVVFAVNRQKAIVEFLL